MVVKVEEATVLAVGMYVWCLSLSSGAGSVDVSLLGMLAFEVGFIKGGCPKEDGKEDEIGEAEEEGAAEI